MDTPVDHVTNDDRLAYNSVTTFEPLASLFEVQPEEEYGWNNTNQSMDPSFAYVKSFKNSNTFFIAST